MVSIWALFALKIFQKMIMSEKCRNNNKNNNNNSDNPLTSRRTDWGKKVIRESLISVDFIFQNWGRVKEQQHKEISH